MRPAARSRALLVLVSLLALPPALAQEPAAEPPEEAGNPARIVTFYPHVFAISRAFPMPGNTQYPWGEDDFSAGYQDPCLGEVAPCADRGTNVLDVYSTAGFVHADGDTWTYEDFHNERGQAKDILLDPTQDITATLYMSADAHGWSRALTVRPVPGIPGVPVWNWDPGVEPDWQVEATLYLANLGEYQGQASEPPPVDETIASGEAVVVATGITEPMTMVSLDETLNPSGGGEVYEFAVNLGKPQVDRIPKEADWVLRYRWWSRTSDTTYVLPVNWNLNSGEFYPNRFTLPVKNPFDVELVYPQFLHQKMLVHAMLNSPWGSYDVDARSVALEVTRDGQPVTLANVQRVADFSVAHGGHYKPVNLTWVWDYQADLAAPGDYRVTVTASNFQHSATSVLDAEFRLRPDGTGQVLRVGRQGQQTSTAAQLDQLGST